MQQATDNKETERQALASRLAYAFERIGSKASVARACEVTEQAVTGWLKTGRVHRKHLPTIAKMARVRLDWLAWGEGEPLWTQEQMDQMESDLKEMGADYNVSPGPQIKGKVPLISWVQAGSAAEVVDIFNPGVADDWIDTTVQIKEHTYALRVEGDSMTPNFPPGTILIVEPDMPAEIGDYVVAKNGDEEATFKQLAKDAGRWLLKPLNRQYPIIPMDDTYHVIGVVREAVQKFR
ncbi:MAG: S24 family peptidase [Halomonas sp.]|nr:S24 family peptidase [Halomonas sp.]